MKTTFVLWGLSCLATIVSAHGVIRNPPSRVLGPAMTKLCGQTAFDIARGDVTASLETVAPNITEGCKHIYLTASDDTKDQKVRALTVFSSLFNV